MEVIQRKPADQSLSEQTEPADNTSESSCPESEDATAASKVEPTSDQIHKVATVTKRVDDLRVDSPKKGPQAAHENVTEQFPKSVLKKVSDDSAGSTAQKPKQVKFSEKVSWYGKVHFKKSLSHNNTTKSSLREMTNFI